LLAAISNSLTPRMGAVAPFPPLPPRKFRCLSPPTGASGERDPPEIKRGVWGAVAPQRRRPLKGLAPGKGVSTGRSTRSHFGTRLLLLSIVFSSSRMSAWSYDDWKWWWEWKYRDSPDIQEDIKTAWRGGPGTQVLDSHPYAGWPAGQGQGLGLGLVPRPWPTQSLGPWAMGRGRGPSPRPGPRPAGQPTWGWLSKT